MGKDQFLREQKAISDYFTTRSASNKQKITRINKKTVKYAPDHLKNKKNGSLHRSLSSLQDSFVPSAWICLIIAGLFEIGWPLGFKLSQTTRFRVAFLAVAVVSMLLSGFFLWLAQRDIPIGTAYAVWTGIGAAGTFLIGVLFFEDPLTLWRAFSFLLIVFGVIGLRVSE